MAGRPSTLTLEIGNAICDYLRSGLYAETACALAKVPEATFYRWMEMGEDAEGHPEHAAFREAVKEASAEAEKEALGKVKAGPQQWQAQAWFLERRFPKRWGKQAQAVDANVTLSAEAMKFLESEGE